MPDTLTGTELRQIELANASARTPVMFVHGLWLLAQSWDRWRGPFEGHGHATPAPGWPGEPATVDVGRDRPELFAGTGVAEVVDHYAAVLSRLRQPPVLVGAAITQAITFLRTALGTEN